MDTTSGIAMTRNGIAADATVSPHGRRHRAKFPFRACVLVAAILLLVKRTFETTVMQNTLRSLLTLQHDNFETSVMNHNSQSTLRLKEPVGDTSLSAANTSIETHDTSPTFESSTRIVTLTGASGATYNVSATTAKQTLSYRNGTGLMVNVHITHHGGTTFCGVIGRALGPNATPSFACMMVDNPFGPAKNRKFKPYNASTSQIIVNNVTIPDYPEFEFPLSGNPWSHNDTAKNIHIVRHKAGFHMVSWEFGFRGVPKTPLSDTDWENTNLVSVIVIRNPMSRLLAGNADTKRLFPAILEGNATREVWLKYADYDRNTNNYALKVLAGNGCCQGQDTDRQHFDNAKALMRRFSFVLDIDCLNQGMAALADVLYISLQRKKPALKKKTHASPRDRIPYPDVYDFLMRKNRYDIELYEWAKQFSLVNCSALPTR